MIVLNVIIKENVDRWVSSEIFYIIGICSPHYLSNKSYVLFSSNMSQEHENLQQFDGKWAYVAEQAGCAGLYINFSF